MARRSSRRRTGIWMLARGRDHGPAAGHDAQATGDENGGDDIKPQGQRDLAGSSGGGIGRDGSVAGGGSGIESGSAGGIVHGDILRKGGKMHPCGSALGRWFSHLMLGRGVADNRPGPHPLNTQNAPGCPVAGGSIPLVNRMAVLTAESETPRATRESLGQTPMVAVRPRRQAARNRDFGRERRERKPRGKHAEIEALAGAVQR
jgi:hypothetical protein